MNNKNNVIFSGARRSSYISKEDRNMIQERMKQAKKYGGRRSQQHRLTMNALDNSHIWKQSVDM